MPLHKVILRAAAAPCSPSSPSSFAASADVTRSLSTSSTALNTIHASRRGISTQGYPGTALFSGKIASAGQRVAGTVSYRSAQCLTISRMNDRVKEKTPQTLGQVRASGTITRANVNSHPSLSRSSKSTPNQDSPSQHSSQRHVPANATSAHHLPSIAQRASFSTSSSHQSPSSPPAASPATISTDTYHELADSYIDLLLETLEVQLADLRDDVDVEYSSGVLKLVVPPQGTYVINKQPPNRQIWLSSPISGPKRYDWVVDAEGGEVAAEGDWVYLRDGSTLTELLREELELDTEELEVLYR